MRHTDGSGEVSRGVTAEEILQFRGSCSTADGTSGQQPLGSLSLCPGVHGCPSELEVKALRLVLLSAPVDRHTRPCPLPALSWPCVHRHCLSPRLAGFLSILAKPQPPSPGLLQTLLL